QNGADAPAALATVYAAQYIIWPETGLTIAPAVWSLCVLLCLHTPVYFRGARLRPGLGAHPADDRREALRAGWLRRISLARALGDYFDQRLDAAAGQRLEAVTPACVCGRASGDR